MKGLPRFNRLSEKIISHRDALTLLELASACLRCADETDFKKIFDGLGELISYDFAVCALLSDGPTTTDDVVNISYPPEWLQIYAERNYEGIDPIMLKNRSDFRLQYWQDTYKTLQPPKAFLSAASDFGLEKGYTHGIQHLRKKGGSLFSVAGRSVERHPRTELIIEYIIPHFHYALSRVLQRNARLPVDLITSREKEVLNWVKLGKSNPEIAVILNISENTVKYHLKTISRKLDTRTRVQTVAAALENGFTAIE